MENVLDKK